MPNLLADQIDTLAAFVPTVLPVISLYLNTQSDDHGRDHFASFLKEGAPHQSQDVCAAVGGTRQFRTRR